MSSEVMDWLGDGAFAQATATLDELAQQLDELRMQKQELQDQLKGVNAEIDEVSKRLAEAAAIQGVTSWKSATLGKRITISEALYASITPEQREEVFEWLRERGLGELIQETVNARTLSAQVKELLAADAEVHPGIRIHKKPRVSLAKA